MFRVVLRHWLFALPLVILGAWDSRPRPVPIVPRTADSTAVAAVPDSISGESGLLDLNRASRADLETLPGIGPALAGRILDFRAAHGGFRHARELLLVRGIGPRKWERLRGRVSPR